MPQVVISLSLLEAVCSGTRSTLLVDSLGLGGGRCPWLSLLEVRERMGTVALKIGSTLVSWSGRPRLLQWVWQLLPPVERGRGSSLPAWQGVATWQVPPGSLDWRWGRRRASLTPPSLAHAGPNQSLATCRVGASGSWRTAGCCGGGVEGRKARGWGGPARPSQRYLLSAQPAAELRDPLTCPSWVMAPVRGAFGDRGLWRAGS